MEGGFPWGAVAEPRAGESAHAEAGDPAVGGAADAGEDEGGGDAEPDVEPEETAGAEGAEGIGGESEESSHGLGWPVCEWHAVMVRRQWPDGGF